jgi:hypothetical protein
MKKVKVSFDFDGTLSRPDVQQYAKELTNRGYECWIITSRISNEQSQIEYSDNYNRDRIYKSNKKLFRVADNCGIKREHIVFTNSHMKGEFIKGNNYLFHLDDDPDELFDIISTSDPCGTVNVDYFEWRESCENILKNFETQI